MIEQIVSVDPVQMEAKELADYTRFACTLADLAAVEILPYFRTAVAVENKLESVAAAASTTGSLASEFDPVTIADKSAESVMRDAIRSAYPDHGILGEEHGLHAGESGLTWVLDPIDGTRAFITGLPLWGCLIALFDGAEPVLGVMDQPYLGERYIGNGVLAQCVESNQVVYGTKTEGTKSEFKARSVTDHHFVEEKGVASKAQGHSVSSISTRHCTTLSDAVMMTTSPDMFKSKAEQSAFNRLVDKVRMARFGGDCYAYCMLARGFVDLVVEADLEAYDIQALIPIVQGAGGVVSNWQGESARAGGQVVAAATPELHRQALAQLDASD